MDCGLGEKIFNLLRRHLDPSTVFVKLAPSLPLVNIIILVDVEVSSNFVCLSSPGQVTRISCLGYVRAIKLITFPDQAKVKAEAAETAEEETTFCSVASFLALVAADLPCSFRLLRREETDDQFV